LIKSLEEKTFKINSLEKTSKIYLFIDESGDPAFYASRKKLLVGQEGFKPLLIIGMIKVEDKKTLRQSIIGFMDELKADPLYNTLPCITNPDGWYLHASYDNNEVQVRFCDFIRKLKNFKFYCIIGRKKLDLFHKKHNGNETEFYFDLVYHLLKDRLNEENTEYQIFLSARNRSSQSALNQAILKAIDRDNSRRKNPININFKCNVVLSKLTPELSVVDYLLWALQRYILKGEQRFYKALENKYNLIIDLYDFDKYRVKGKSNYYHARNRFTFDKADKFRDDGYI